MNDRERAAALMRRQRGLALRVAATFVAVLIGLPLLNQFAPGLMATPVFGFPLTWALLGILFFPFAWGLARWFVSASDRVEDEIVREWKR